MTSRGLPRTPVPERRPGMWRKRDCPLCTSLSTRTRFLSKFHTSNTNVAQGLGLTWLALSLFMGYKATRSKPGRSQAPPTRGRLETLAGHSLDLGMFLPGAVCPSLSRTSQWKTLETSLFSGRLIFFPRNVLKPGSWFSGTRQPSRNTSLRGLSTRTAFLLTARGLSTTYPGRGPWQDRFCLSFILLGELSSKKCVFKPSVPWIMAVLS